jgi:hypothetical protein
MKEREPQADTSKTQRIVAKLKQKKVLAMAIVGTSVALAGCGNKTNNNEASTTNREKPAATEVQHPQKTVPTETQQETNPTDAQQTAGFDSVVEVENYDGIGGFPLKSSISREGSEYEFHITNTHKDDAGHFIVRIGAMDNTAMEIRPSSIDTGGFERRSVNDGQLVEVDVPGLKSGDTLTMRANFPNAFGVMDETQAQFIESGAEEYFSLRSGILYYTGTGKSEVWTPTSN